jgi:hypothetical protein
VSFISLFVLVLHCSSVRGPYIYLTFFLSNILSAFTASVVTVFQDSDPYASIGPVRVLFSFKLVFWDRSYDLKGLMCARHAWFAVMILQWICLHFLFIACDWSQLCKAVSAFIFKITYSQILEIPSGLYRGHLQYFIWSLIPFFCLQCPVPVIFLFKNVMLLVLTVSSVHAQICMDVPVKTMFSAVLNNVADVSRCLTLLVW